MSLGLKEMLIGQNPLDPEALWEKMYVGTAMSGRRGLGICAMGAIDMALWDIKGKAVGKPIWELLGGNRTRVKPYASLLPDGNTLDDYAENLKQKLVEAKKFGFEAAKLEVCINGPYSHGGLQEDDAEIIRIVGRCRDAVGPNMTLMVDVAYCWNDWKRALHIIQQLEPYDLFFFETPLQADDMDGYAALSERSPIKIAAGEWLQTRFEFQELIDRGHVHVAQPDIGRVGGITEARRVVDYAQKKQRLVVPHCWKTAVGIAASAHVAAAAPNCPYIEFLPAALSESVIRRELVKNEFKLEGGYVGLPKDPGLGIELNEEAVRKYTVA